ncbi:hypothetical protein [Pseudomonas corrugata]|uniref:hypothetical protein n=1 Tax=Pseudomonas corrugata TaxID=47879 RepID=UPI001586D892|nr:hypothetical protein [Pseudomonas corrugata]MCI0997767.1 hypothetical protein [Pseudomonas corrugata]NUT69438.1 hypothetical protein [Pseudomonas corrugata]
MDSVTNRNNVVSVKQLRFDEERITMLLDEAYSLKDPVEQIRCFEGILLDPAAERVLSRPESGRLHWNKALAHTKNSERHFNEGREPALALREHDLAVLHMRKAKTYQQTAEGQESTEWAR